MDDYPMLTVYHGVPALEMDPSLGQSERYEVLNAGSEDNMVCLVS